MAQVSITPLGAIPQVRPLDFSQPFDRLFDAVIKRNEREKDEEKRIEIAEGFNQLRSTDPDIQSQGFNRVLSQDSKLAGAALRFLEPGMKQRIKDEQAEKRTEIRKKVIAGNKEALAELSPTELNSLINLKTIQNKAEEDIERKRVANAASNATEILKGKTNRAQINKINLMMENIESNLNLTDDQKNESIRDLIRLGEMSMEGREIALSKTKRAARVFDTVLSTVFEPEAPATTTQISDIDPSKFTPKSLQKFNASQNFGDLVPITKGPSSQIIASLAPLFLGGVDFDDPAEFGTALGRLQVIGDALNGKDPKEVQKVIRSLATIKKDKPKTEEKSITETVFGKTAGDFWDQPIEKIVSDIRGFKNPLPEQQVLPQGGQPETQAVPERPTTQRTRAQRPAPRTRSLAGIQKLKQFSKALTDNEGFVYIPDNRFPSGRRFIHDRSGNKIKAE